MISGSSSMLSEATHSLADTVTEVLLFVALRRGAKPADRSHPLGYGREAYLWALLAALATFVAGAVVSILDGVDRILHGGETGDTAGRLRRARDRVRAGGDLAPASPAAGAGQRAALPGAHPDLPRGDHRHRGQGRHLRGQRRTRRARARGGRVSDSTTVTGNSLYDGTSSILIGVLLVIVAASLARSNTSLLVGRAAPLGLDQALRAELESLPDVTSVPVFVTSVTGPRRLLVAAKVEFRDGCTTDDIERIADEAERRLVARFAGIEYVFLDPPRGREPSASEHAFGKEVARRTCEAPRSGVCWETTGPPGAGARPGDRGRPGRAPVVRPSTSTIREAR